MFSDDSVHITNILPKEERKKNGIYFTPFEGVKFVCDTIEGIKKTYNRILEPSAGSGEFVNYLLQKFPTSEVVALEKNDTIIQNISYNCIHTDFIKYDVNEKFDLIIGNPPYYTIPKNNIPSVYNKYYAGRPNIYILFIIKSIKMLNEGGVLAFIVPKNFTNCTYYDLLRKAIYRFYNIIIKNMDVNFMGTEQNVILLIVQKTRDCADDYVLNIGPYTIFTAEKNILQDLLVGHTTLREMGANIYVGTVVWNQVKHLLTNNPEDTLLIYSSDIKNGVLEPVEYKNVDKKNYITLEGKNKPILVLNRGYGSGAYSFNYCIINHHNYLIENHLICIECEDPETLDIILRSFKDSRTAEFIKYYFCTNTINISELYDVLPIYI